MHYIYHIFVTSLVLYMYIMACWSAFVQPPLLYIWNNICSVTYYSFVGSVPTKKVIFKAFFNMSSFWNSVHAVTTHKANPITTCM